jgi:hypothetical protein
LAGEEDTMTETRLLRKTLTVNAIATALSGVALTVGAVPLAPLFGLPGPLPMAAFGLALVGFALYVWRVRREPVDLAQARAVFIMDVAYVIASLALIVAWPQALSWLGRIGVGLMADVVAVFALLEFVGLRRARRGLAAAHA